MCSFPHKNTQSQRRQIMRMQFKWRIEENKKKTQENRKFQFTCGKVILCCSLSAVRVCDFTIVYYAAHGHFNYDIAAVIHSTFRFLHYVSWRRFGLRLLVINPLFFGFCQMSFVHDSSFFLFRTSRATPIFIFIIHFFLFSFVCFQFHFNGFG